MDILTQALLGSALAQSVASQKNIRVAAGVGALAGIIADADVLIASSTDPLLNIEYHRHFTHALAFIPVGGLVIALMLWPLLRRRIEFSRLYLFSLLGFSLSGFIDACTSYGTHLFWPFSGERVAFHIISIVDPLFSGILLIGVIWSAWKLKSRAVHIALVLCGVYLALGVVQLNRANSLALALADSRNHQVDRIVVKPTLGNLLLWRSTYIADSRIYVDAVRPGITATKVYPGESVALFVPEQHAGSVPKDSRLYRDIQRFSRFSDGFIAMDPNKKGILGDVRYSMVPNSTRTLWGIALDWNNPDRHVTFGFDRDNSAEERSRFLSMVLGK
jgi:inner membrane protein